MILTTLDDIYDDSIFRRSPQISKSMQRHAIFDARLTGVIRVALSTLEVRPARCTRPTRGGVSFVCTNLSCCPVLLLE